MFVGFDGLTDNDTRGSKSNFSNRSFWMRESERPAANEQGGRSQRPGFGEGV